MAIEAPSAETPSVAPVTPDETSGEPPLLTDAQLDELAEVTAADERTILRRLVGLPVRGRRAGVIDRAIDQRGIPRWGR